MDKLFDSKWVLRGTAMLLAVLLYFYVVSIEGNNESSASVEMDIITNVPLEVYYDDDNLLVTGVPETVDVKIEGPAAIVQRTKLLEDYKIFVDLNSLLIGEHSVTIQTENFSDKLEVTIDPKIIDIVIEEKITQEFRVDPEINSRQLNEDYVVKNMEAEPQRVLITGAKSLIESVSYVKATVKGEENIKASFTQEANVIVLNKDLNKLDVSIEPEKIDVKVEVEQYSRVLPIRLEEKGTLPEGIVLDSIQLEQEEMIVYGTKVVLDTMEEVVATYDLSKLKESDTYEASVELPEGVSKTNPEKVKFKATITVNTSSDLEMEQ